MSRVDALGTGKRRTSWNTRFEQEAEDDIRRKPCDNVLGRRVWHWEKLVGQTTEGNIRKTNHQKTLFWGRQPWHWQD